MPFLAVASWASVKLGTMFGDYILVAGFIVMKENKGLLLADGKRKGEKGRSWQVGCLIMNPTG